MARVYIDTNVFLDFYQSATDRLGVFQQLVERAGQVVLTEQTVKEFRRNRAARLATLAKEIRRKAQASVFTTSVVRELPQFQQIIEARDSVKSLADEMATQLEAWISDDQSDSVLREFDNLVEGALVLNTTDKAIERAQLRKQLGEPPTSPDRHTIGDELIWETLISEMNEDLVIVSRDNTFVDNVGILRREYEAVGGRSLLAVTKHLRDGLEQVGAASEEIETEEREIESRRSDMSIIEGGVCAACGGVLEETGFEGSDGDSAWWMYCAACGRDYFPD